MRIRLSYCFTKGAPATPTSLPHVRYRGASGATVLLLSCLASSLWAATKIASLDLLTKKAKKVNHTEFFTTAGDGCYTFI